VLATVVTALAQSLYTAERAVPQAEWRTLLANAAAAACWLLVSPQTLWACALLFALRALLVAAFLLPRLGPPRRPDFADRDLREVLRESRVLLLAATYYKSEPFVDRLLLATVAGGAAAAFHLAQQVVGMVSLLMNRLVTAPLVAPLSASVHAADAGLARRLMRRALARMLATGLAAWLLFALAGLPLLQLLFAGTALDAAAIAASAQLLVLLGGYLLGVLCGQVLAQGYYCTGDTRRMVWLGVAGYTLGLLLKALALWRFGVPGLAAAASLSWLLNALALRAFLPLRRLPALRT
jgi:peptidoglycan biosynthesis protein MviN/MurJ (putative lipid II flippase)